MPRAPSLALSATVLRESIFSRLAGKLASHPDAVPFHLGDTHVLPALPGPLDLEDPSLFRYGAPFGSRELVSAIVDRLRARPAFSWIEPENVLVTVGGTAALSAAARTVLDPGDECIVPSPHWPLIRGILTNAGAHPREVPFSSILYRAPAADVARILAPAITGKTAALYVTTPNNPDGKVLSEDNLAALARLASEHDLWILADEAYESFAYASPHVSIAGLESARGRTLTAFSFSKSCALAGFRLGALIGPKDVLHAARKIANHTVYNVPEVLQRRAAELLTSPTYAAWEKVTKAAYVAARDEASRLFPIPHPLPEGATYLFADMRAAMRPGERTLWPLVEELLDAGVSISPGEQFGRGYDTWARLCFTAVPRERVVVGMERIRSVIATRLARGEDRESEGLEVGSRKA